MHESTIGRGSAGNVIAALASLVVPKRFPQHRQIVRQIALFYNSIRPNRLHQLVFANELPVILNQHQKSIEDLRS